MGSYDDNDSDNELQRNGSPTPPFIETLQASPQFEDLCSKLIPMYNRLVDVFRAVDDRDEQFNLPEIVVVGSQVFYSYTFMMLRVQNCSIYIRGL